MRCGRSRSYPRPPSPAHPATRTAGTYQRWSDQHHAEVMAKLTAIEKAVNILTAALPKS
jgi:hypothetical protein